MDDLEGQIPTNVDDTSIESKNELVFHLDNVNLTEGNPQSEAIDFIIEKRPIEMIDGRTYGNPGGVLIDEESPIVLTMAAQAEEIQNFPEMERPRRIMDLLYSKLQYAYPSKIDEIAKNDPQKAEWIEKKIDKGKGEVRLSELFENGYGICRHLSVAYLWLAQKAGLHGVILKSDPILPITNIVRSDTNAPLFKLTEVGQNAPAHAWVELMLEDNKWIPICPSTNLIGDTEEGMEMFRKANFKAAATYDIEASVLQKDSVNPCFKPAFYDPGSPSTMGAVYASIREEMDFISGKRKKIPYSGSVDIVVTEDESYSDNKSVIKNIV